MEASLYIHVPFCASACEYCDFYSAIAKPGDPRFVRYTATLLLEAERLFKTYPFAGVFPLSEYSTDLSLQVPTIFIGGGTPSVLGAVEMSRLLSGLSELIARYSSSSPVEITVEANPESVDEAFLSAIREGGVTRLSMGVQTLYSPSRRAVNRLGDETLVYRKLSLSSKYFPGAFSVDLMSGLPFQDEKVILNDIAAVLLYKPVHVSLYALTSKLKTTLASPDQDEADKLWILGRDTLEKAGFSQYEVSNFCLPGKESLHNIRYWRMYNWLALGPAASGTIINDRTGTGFRYTIPHDVDAWLSAKGYRFSRNQKRWRPDTSGVVRLKTEELDTITLMKESLLMGFRYIKGLDEELFRRRFRLGLVDLIPKTLASWRNQGTLQKSGLALTKEGLLFLDRFLIEAFEELDAVFSTW